MRWFAIALGLGVVLAANVPGCRPRPADTERRVESPLQEASRGETQSAPPRANAESSSESVDGPTAAERRLAHAIGDDDVEAVRDALDAGASLTTMRNPRKSPLALAAESGATNVARFLLERGAKPEPDPPWTSTIQRAVQGSHWDVVLLLLDHGEPVPTDEMMGEDLAPHRAAQDGRADVIARLLEEGCPPSLRDQGLATPLHCAVTADVARALLTGGANRDARDAAGLTPLARALAEGRPDVAAALVEAGARDVASRGSNAMHLAARSGSLECLEIARALGASPTAADERGCTPLHFAASGVAVRFLADRGAQVDARDAAENTPLHLASDRAAYETVVELLRLGADPGACSQLGTTPLMAAAASGSDAIARKLLEAGADPDVQRPDGDAAIHIAARAGYQAVVDELLGHGANPSLRTALGRTPLHEACLWGASACVYALLMSSADENAVDDDGLTPLHLAAQGGRVSSVQELLGLRAKADVNARDREGRTPLLLACAWAQTTKYGRWGAISKEPPGSDHELVARMLLAAGADPNLASEDGVTPLHLAAVEGNKGLCLALLDHGARASAEVNGKDAGRLARTGGPNTPGFARAHGMLPGAPAPVWDPEPSASPRRRELADRLAETAAREAATE